MQLIHCHPGRAKGAIRDLMQNKDLMKIPDNRFAVSGMINVLPLKL